jgi:NTP pyrophosphatase (non-canonical NTP hydrolase)
MMRVIITKELKMKSLNQLRDEIHANAKEKGFYDNPREVGTMLMLVVSELAEALDADRADYFCDFSKYEECRKEAFEFKHKQETDVRFMPRSPYSIQSSEEIEKDAFERYIKDTFEDELADVIIRTLDICGYLKIDIERSVLAKIKYNKTRDKLHAKRY